MTMSYYYFVAKFSGEYRHAVDLVEVVAKAWAMH